MENDPPHTGTGPAQKQPGTIRTRNAALLAAASLVLGVGIGAAGATSTATPGPSASTTVSKTQAAELSTTPKAEPTQVATFEPTIEPTSAPTPQPAGPVVVKGKGTQKTKPFDMPDGDITVVVTGSGDGNVIVDLVPRGGKGSTGLFNEISHRKYRYETVAYGVVSGS
jgi:hypothetical protein